MVLEALPNIDVCGSVFAGSSVVPGANVLVLNIDVVPPPNIVPPPKIFEGFPLLTSLFTDLSVGVPNIEPLELSERALGEKRVGF